METRPVTVGNKGVGYLVDSDHSGLQFSLLLLKQVANMVDLRSCRHK